MPRSKGHIEEVSPNMPSYEEFLKAIEPYCHKKWTKDGLMLRPKAWDGITDFREELNKHSTKPTKK